MIRLRQVEAVEVAGPRVRLPVPVPVPVRAVAKLDRVEWEVRAAQEARMPAERREWAERAAVVEVSQMVHLAANQPMEPCAPRGSSAAIRAELKVANSNASNLVPRIHQVVRMAARFCPEP